MAYRKDFARPQSLTTRLKHIPTEGVKLWFVYEFFASELLCGIPD